jgi:hypothetical protein
MLLVLGIAGVRSSATGYRPSIEPTNGVSATTYGYLYLWKNVARVAESKTSKTGLAQDPTPIPHRIPETPPQKRTGPCS